MTFRTLSNKIQSCAISDVGLVRTNNEDAWGELPQEHFYVLADGMGGHNAGEIASQETVKILCEWRKQINAYSTEKMNDQEIADLLEAALCMLNRNIYQMGCREKRLKGMGTTLCSLFFHDNHLIYAHIGDSRIYRFRDKKLEQMTQDHSLLNELIKRGKLDKTQSEWFVYKNVITRAIGVDIQVEPELNITEVYPGDQYLMCSDGLSDYVSYQDIELIFNKNHSIEETCIQLVDKAKKAGGYDNITILLTNIE
jgi:PPM family protein phosphatase